MDYLPVVVLFALFAANVPVAFALAIAGLSFFLLSSGIQHQIFIQRFVSVTHSFPLLAIPFFIMTGVIMNHSGITERLMKLADSFTGHMVGGLAQVNILLSTLMGGMSGSANADTAMQSKIMVPQMDKRGYHTAFSAVVTASSSIISVIIPPGIGLILYGFMGDVSIGKLFLAGILPGIVLCIALMLVTSHISRLRSYAPSLEKKASWGSRFTALKKAIWSLMVPVGIVGGIRFGIFTPTEAGAMAVLYAIIVGYIHKQFSIRKVPDILIETVTATSAVMFIICAASTFGFFLSWERIPAQIAELMLGISDNPYALLLLINLLLLAIGMFIEGGAALILLTPILVPVITEVGIDPVHFGIVMVLNLTIAGVTPPLGTLMFTACSISKIPVKDFVRELVPYIATLIAVLLLLTFVPQISLWLPGTMK
ncbi:TRAP transporter large permease [Parasalinivibrio latis]|uniref:TRAP transporter large permease n=1 Tax=Parasalinivibrio latis TaxID=2952610 RepID=UPI0030E5F6DE